MGKSRNSLMGDPKTSLRTQVSRESSTSVRSVKEAPIRRSADKDIRLPAVAAPSIGIRVTIDDFPLAGFVTRPCVSFFTSGVFIQSPGSVGLPRLTTVFPSVFDAPCAGAVASALCSGVVVSNAATVWASGAGGGAAVAGVKGVSLTCSSVLINGSEGAFGVSVGAGAFLFKPNRSATPPMVVHPVKTMAMRLVVMIVFIPAPYARCAPASITQLPLAV